MTTDQGPGAGDSSIAAESLRRVGLRRATDLAGGAEAWMRAGLPPHRDRAGVRR